MVSLCVFKKWANPVLFFFVLSKHKFYRTTVGFSGIRTWIVRVEGEHADHHHGPGKFLLTGWPESLSKKLIKNTFTRKWALNVDKIVSTGFKKSPKHQQIAQSGHTLSITLCWKVLSRCLPDHFFFTSLPFFWIGFNGLYLELMPSAAWGSGIFEGRARGWMNSVITLCPCPSWIDMTRGGGFCG